MSIRACATSRAAGRSSGWQIDTRGAIFHVLIGNGPRLDDHGPITRPDLPEHEAWMRSLRGGSKPSFYDRKWNHLGPMHAEGGDFFDPVVPGRRMLIGISDYDLAEQWLTSVVVSVVEVPFQSLPETGRCVYCDRSVRDGWYRCDPPCTLISDLDPGQFGALPGDQEEP